MMWHRTHARPRIHMHSRYNTCGYFWKAKGGAGEREQTQNRGSQTPHVFQPCRLPTDYRGDSRLTRGRNQGLRALPLDARCRLPRCGAAQGGDDDGDAYLSKEVGQGAIVEAWHTSGIRASVHEQELWVALVLVVQHQLPIRLTEG